MKAEGSRPNRPKGRAPPVHLELLGSEGRVLAADLSSRYRVSEDTIRRDLRELASSGRSNGYTAAPCLAVPRPFLRVSPTNRHGEQDRNARAAADMIRDGQVC